LGHAERCRDVLDGLLLGRAHALPSLPVGRRDLIGHREHEASVVIELLIARLVIQQRRRVTQMAEGRILELLGVVELPVVHARLLGHDLVEKLALAMLGARLDVSLRHRHGLPEHPSVRRGDDHQARGVQHRGELVAADLSVRMR
jgi:hypothetical protein